MSPTKTLTTDVCMTRPSQDHATSQGPDWVPSLWMCNPLTGSLETGHSNTTDKCLSLTMILAQWTHNQIKIIRTNVTYPIISVHIRL